MPHVVLLGDSIFDNARYVPDRPAVITQLRAELPDSWSATLIAVDGHMIEDIDGQLNRLPADATHLVVSVGGNDALSASALLQEPAVTVGDALAILHDAIVEYRAGYVEMLKKVLSLRKPTAICTVYDRCRSSETRNASGSAASTTPS